MLNRTLRPLLYVLAVYHLLVFTIPHVTAFYQDLISAEASADDQMDSDDRSGDFIIELKEMEELEENDASSIMLDLLSLSTQSLLCFCVTPQSKVLSFNYHSSSLFPDAVPLHLRFRKLLI